jgi:hypothetical protein
MAYALQSTEWEVGAVNVSTKRTWTSTEDNALSILRHVQSIHGGFNKIIDKVPVYCLFNCTKKVGFRDKIIHAKHLYLTTFFINILRHHKGHSPRSDTIIIQ